MQILIKTGLFSGRFSIQEKTGEPASRFDGSVRTARKNTKKTKNDKNRSDFDEILSHCHFKYMFLAKIITRSPETLKNMTFNDFFELLIRSHFLWFVSFVSVRRCCSVPVRSVSCMLIRLVRTAEPPKRKKKNEWK